jgi:hypothetical protein
MIQKFDDIRTNPARALQVYLILMGAAKNRQTLTYRGLADTLQFGGKGAGVLAHILGHIMYWCHEEGLPSLTSLVVNKESGLPGPGLSAPADVNSERERIYEYDWYAIVPPAMEQLAAAYARGSAKTAGAA